MKPSDTWLVLCQSTVCGERLAEELTSFWRKQRLYPWVYLSLSDCLGICVKNTALLCEGGKVKLLSLLQPEDIDSLKAWALSKKTTRSALKGLNAHSEQSDD